MEKILQLRRNEGDPFKAELYRVQLSGVTDLVLIVDGKKRRFQYDSRIYHDTAMMGNWVNGYLMEGKAWENIEIRFIAGKTIEL